MSTEQLSMSMFASRADYDAAVRAQGEQLPDALQQTVNALEWISGRADEHKDKIDAIRAEHAQRLTLQHHACDQAQRIADLETKCVTLKRLHDAAADERNTARGAVRELERQVFALQQQRDVLQTCLDRHQRDEVDPPGYLQDAVIRAAGLGALHTERDAAIKERDELRARLAGIEAQEPVAWQCQFTNRIGWDQCTREHYAHVRENQAAWPDYEVRALIAAAPEHKA